MAAMLALTATSAQAQSTPTSGIFRASVIYAIGGKLADGASTVRFLHNGSGCLEANPLVGSHPSAWTLAAGSAVTVTATVLASTLLERQARRETGRSRTFLHGFAVGLNAFTGSVGAASAVRNVALCGW